jgi:hypothetical protein
MRQTRSRVVRRLRALAWFVLGYAALMLLGPLAGVPLALGAFYAGGLVLLAEPEPEDQLARIARELAQR